MKTKFWYAPSKSYIASLNSSESEQKNSLASKKRYMSKWALWILRAIDTLWLGICRTLCSFFPLSWMLQSFSTLKIRSADFQPLNVNTSGACKTVLGFERGGLKREALTLKEREKKSQLSFVHNIRDPPFVAPTLKWAKPSIPCVHRVR